MDTFKGGQWFSGRVLDSIYLYVHILYVHSSNAINLMWKRELVALLNLSLWCLVMVERLFLAVPGGCLQFVIVVFPDHTHLLFFLFNARNAALLIRCPCLDRVLHFNL